MSWIGYKVEWIQRNHYTRQGGLDLLMPTSATASNISGSSYLWLLLLNGQNNTQAWFMKGSACYFATGGMKGTAAIKQPPSGTFMKSSKGWKILRWAEF